MEAERLLRLYPRAWRDRYGEEILAVVGSGPLGAQQAIDLIAGALDAWLSSDVRRATRPARAPANEGGNLMWQAMKASCAQPGLRMTRRDAVIGALVVLGTTAVFALLGVAARRRGLDVAYQVLMSLAFPGSVVLSMPFTYLKGQPWRAQAAIMGVTLLLVVLIGLAAGRV